MTAFQICRVCLVSVYKKVLGLTAVLHSQVLLQLNLPISTMSLVDEDGDLERASKPWTLVQSGHTIGNPEPIFSEMVFVVYSC